VTEQERALSAWARLRPHGPTPLGRGLINQTWAVDAAAGRFVLQRVSPVFDPRIHHNIAAVTARLRAHGMVTPELVETDDGAPWASGDGAVWRLMTRVPGVTFDAVAQPAQAAAAGRLLARFHAALDGLDHAFVGMRTGVHHTAAHLHALEDALAEHATHRLAGEVAPLAAEILASARRLPAPTGAPPRVVHGDPKFNNVLFAGEHGEARLQPVCMVDLDTVGPMPLSLELGDAWRSWCNRAGEDEAVARFDAAVFDAALGGYAEASTLALAPAEREALVHGVEWITLELAARFLADALHERYFGWDPSRFATRGQHNLVRARGQWSLHAQVVADRPRRAAAIRDAL
jgi:Ser/Thr protein kinase RdoA (MazF antagonist)